MNVADNVAKWETLRTMPPSLSFEYSRAHDVGSWETLPRPLWKKTLSTNQHLLDGQLLATIPMRLGGSGRSAPQRDAQLHMISQRTPAVADLVVHGMADEPEEGFLAKLHEATSQLDHVECWL